MLSRDFDLRGQKWRQELSSVAVQFRKRGEPKSVFIHVVHENYRYLDVFVVIDVVIVQVP